jgi:FkbM family methyltransferase
MLQKYKKILSTIRAKLPQLLGLPEEIAKLQESLIVIQERNKTDLARLLFRIDALSAHIDDNLPIRKRNHVISLMQHSEIFGLLKSDKSKASYSQYRDDIIFEHIFSVLGIDRPTYIDIGAHHPTYLSNTARLYDRGCSGVNIEANPVLFDEFSKTRPRDVNLNLGVGPKAGLMKFWLIKDSPALSTFEVAQVERLMRIGKVIEKELEVEVVRLESIIEEHLSGNFPDFMTIDVEGGDYGILESINFGKYRPKVICVEINTHDRLLRCVEIEFLLFKNGYFHFGDVGGGIEGRNALFVDAAHHDKFIIRSGL